MSDLECESSMFGELIDWSSPVLPPLNQIRSLQISNDPSFSSEDLDNICHLAALRQLFLHNLPNLHELPPSLMKLDRLRVLSITQCPITQLSLSLRFLGDLETLRLDCNHLLTLPLFLAVMPSLRLLLVRKPVSLCTQCRLHPRKTTRIVILSSPADTNHTQVPAAQPLSLAVTAASSFLSLSSNSALALVRRLRLIWPVLSHACMLPLRCTVCQGGCGQEHAVSADFTRLHNCKCLHLAGFICSERCRDLLAGILRRLHPNATVLTSREAALYDSCVQRHQYSRHHRQRIRALLLRLFTCVSLYHKHSYNVSAAAAVG